MIQGMVQVYTGNGKGKTTAAIGQGIRSVGRGLKVYMIQFLKSGETGELKTCNQLGDCFQIFRFEKPRGFFWKLKEEEKKALKEEIEKAFGFAQKVVNNNQCDVLILDEIMGVMSNQVIAVEQICTLIKSKPANMELILTGRNVPQEVVDLADYVSEIQAVKHPMDNGVPARKGIEY